MNGNLIDKTIFITGGNFGQTFIHYVVGLTHKDNPEICFVPTAVADNPYNINDWYALSANLSLKPQVLRTFISSSPDQKTFEDILLNMDAIIIGGGNTLNMLAIWKAQGIDRILKKAYEKGIILAGGSAGSMCWFKSGYTDSRPKMLSYIECLGFLDYSHCPHYHSEADRKPLFYEGILKGQLQDTYACDDMAGLLFVNGGLNKAISLNNENNSYFLSVANGIVKEELLLSEIIN
ncbi:MAG: Type 1 glutamine amidotransferase-like domain-containing protein [Chitinophagaceae bacterium]